MNNMILKIFIGIMAIGLVNGCASTQTDLLQDKKDGSGASEIYLIKPDEARNIAIRIIQDEGNIVSEDNIDEGYILASTSENKSPELGIWLTPIDEKYTEVTVVGGIVTTSDFVEGGLLFHGNVAKQRFHKLFAKKAGRPIEAESSPTLGIDSRKRRNRYR